MPFFAHLAQAAAVQGTSNNWEILGKKGTRYHKYDSGYIPHTNTRMICCVHACTGTNTANLSKPTACMNRSITSTLPRTWQDINRSLDPTVASNWQLSIKRYTSESRPSHPPLRSQPSPFHWMMVMPKLHCSMYVNLWYGASQCGSKTS